MWYSVALTELRATRTEELLGLFRCSGLVQVIWQHGFATAQPSWAEEDPGVVLHLDCLGAGQGRAADTGVECIKCWCQSQSWAQAMDNASPLCLSH